MVAINSFERKKREKKYSLNRRSRLRKAYFKLTGSERPAESLESHHNPRQEKFSNLLTELDLDEPDSEEENGQIAAENPPPQLTKKQLASRKRMEKYREMKLVEERRKQAEIKRNIKHKKATARTKKGQPKLGAQVGLLLDKIRESSN